MLDYHQPGARTEPSPRLDLEDDDDESGGEAEPEASPVAAGALLEQIRGLYGPGGTAKGPLSAEVVRFLGEELLSVDLVVPGERRGPLGGAMAVVEVRADGKALLSVPEADAEVTVVPSPDGEGVSHEAPVGGLEVPAAGRAVVRHGEGLLLVRAVAASSPRRPRLDPGRVAALVLLASALAALALWALLAPR